MKNNKTEKRIIYSSDGLEAVIYPLAEYALVIESLTTQAIPSDSPQALAVQTAFWSLSDKVDKLAIKGIKESVLGQRNLTVVFDPFLADRLRVSETLVSLWSQCQQSLPDPRLDDQAPTLRLPIYFGGEQGPDLRALAASLTMSCEQVVQQYCRNLYTVLFLGFQPGFAYLHGLPQSLIAPRLTHPRGKIPAGSLAIGGEQTGIYPSDSPGGWQIIGRISDAFMPLFDPHARPPNRLQPGDTIHFYPQTHT